jgi:hypothetical protein
MITGGGELTAKGEARSNFAAQHLAAAEYFRGQVVEIETMCSPSKETFAPPEYQHCWFAAVVFAVMAMEANAHDLMTAAERKEASPIGTRRFRIEDLRKPLLERYKLLHQVAKAGAKLPIEKGVGQDARGLVRLRDEIVHYKTEWRSNPIVSKRIEDLLRTRIPLNPFKCGDIFFPEQCISGGSAQWAIDTARGFIEMFAKITAFRLMI